MKTFKFTLCQPGAKPPVRAHPQDSGFDLTLLKKVKTVGKTDFYSTGVCVQPCEGIYFDLVARSSISKSGYILANGIGIIDRNYTGEILVPLIKIDPSAEKLKTPIKIVQLIPRNFIEIKAVHVDFLDTTDRNSDGFGSTSY